MGGMRGGGMGMRGGRGGLMGMPMNMGMGAMGMSMGMPQMGGVGITGMQVTQAKLPEPLSSAGLQSVENMLLSSSHLLYSLPQRTVCIEV